MPKYKRLKCFESLLSELEKRDIQFIRSENKPCLSISTRLFDQVGTLNIFWEPVAWIIQFIHILPLSVPKQYCEKMAIQLNRINLAMPIMGFIMNERSRLFEHRLHLLLDEDKAISFNVIYSHIDLSIRLTKEILPELQKALSSASNNCN